GTSNLMRQATVQVGYVGDDELTRVEDGLAAGNRLALRRSGVRPSAKQREHKRIETARWTSAGSRHRRPHVERIVDAEAEQLARERGRPAECDAFGEAARRPIDDL